MKTVILCGGLGTRLSEETKVIPKPMVKIGNQPILCHILDIYLRHGFKDFILATGYKSQVIEKFFKNKKSPYNIKIVNTGKKTLTGGRLLRLKKYFKKNETFMLTYGDGVGDINIKKLLKFHKSHKKIASVTAVHPPVRFGELEIKDTKVVKFEEKPQVKAGWINGGFFILADKIFDYIKDDDTVFEREPLEKLSKGGQLMAYRHEGFWKCMDTMRDKILLNKLWNKGNALWKK